jgi:hypothetical protein
MFETMSKVDSGCNQTLWSDPNQGSSLPIGAPDAIRTWGLYLRRARFDAEALERLGAIRPQILRD